MPVTRCALIVVLGSMLAPAAAVAGPDDDLLRLAPPDAHLVLLVKDLRGQTAAVAGGPFAHAARESRLGRAVAALPEVGRLASVRQRLETALGVEWPRFRDDILGDAVVFAYQAGPPGKPEQERGLFMTWVKDQKLADEILKRLDKVQKDSGELERVEALEYKGAPYVKRVKAKGPSEFVLRRGPVLAISAQEAMIHDVIARAHGNNGSPASKYERLTARDALASLWLNPRSFDAELDAKLKQVAGAEAAFLATFARCWKALDGIALSVRLDREIELNLALAVDKTGFPVALLKLAGSLNAPSALYAAFPPDALLRVACRAELPALLESLSSFMTPEAWQALTDSFENGIAPVMGKKHLGQLATHLGPDWGICVSAPASAKTVWPEIVAAVRVKPSPDGALEKALLDACDTVATLTRLKHGADADEPIRIETRRAAGYEIKYLAHDKLFPPGFRPAYALRDGFLVVASSPDAIPRLDFARKSATNEPNRLLSLSARALGQFLAERREPLTAHLAGDKEDVTKLIDKLVILAEVINRVELVNESKVPGQMRLSLKLIPTQPLKK